MAELEHFQMADFSAVSSYTDFEIAPPCSTGGGRLWVGYPPPMSEIIKFKPPQKSPEYFTGICECGNDSFQTLFGPEDPDLEARHLIALRCAECGEELRAYEPRLDS